MDDLLRLAFEMLPNFVVVDAKGTIAYLNESYAKLLGITAQEAIGRPVEEFIPNTRLNIVLKTGQAEMGSVMTLHDHRIGREVMVVCNRVPIYKNDALLGVAAVTAIGNILDVGRLYDEIELIKQENQRYKEELAAIKSEIKSLDRVIGRSDTIAKVKKTICEYAKSNLTFLITGETGVGKEVFARAVHQLSNRALNHYVKINCAAIPANLLESELFGYAEGAFSGASRGGKVGKFEQANGGTLLLDEIGELPLELQSKLLRVLQEKEIERVGGVKPISIDVRVICCTNQDLEERVREGKFREDLYYRINVVELYIPPLRERKEDIPLLGAFFIGRVNQENGLAVTGLDGAVERLFQAYGWPGNVRELEHAVERAAIRCKSGPMTLEHFDFLVEKARRRVARGSDDDTLRARTAQAEQETILHALEKAGGNKSKAAQLLGIDRSRLYSKLKKYHLD